jgi:hypothetical protein
MNDIIPRIGEALLMAFGMFWKTGWSLAVPEWLPACPQRACHAAAVAACKNVTPWQLLRHICRVGPVFWSRAVDVAVFGGLAFAQNNAG